ncbi:MAG: ATP-binding protein [Candidatus Methanomethyliaceae archaeon]|nr:ATP-binding protein [Candidatus Methanomethyliaceae archaeon]MDW7971345.1 ATP-binding protein [Nitrososphaerota archaeon]
MLEILSAMDFIVAILDENRRIKWINKYGENLGLNKEMIIEKNSKVFSIPDKGLLIYYSIAKINGDFLLIGAKFPYVELIKTLPFPSLIFNEENIIDANREFLNRYHYKDLRNKKLNEIMKIEEAVVLDSNRNPHNVKIEKIQIFPEVHMAFIFEEDISPILCHQLKNTVQSLVLQSHMIREILKSLSDATRREFENKKLIDIIYKIDKNIRILERTITSFLSLYKEPIKEDVEIDQILRETISIMNIPNNIEVAIKFENNQKLKLDFLLLMNALMNIIENSIEAMPNGGKLEITMNRIESELIIKIKDTGGGMPKEILNKLFTPFLTTKRGGSGLGLYISKKIIEKLGGRIEVESELGRGTTFSIILPLK